jgi:hypothetical protein
MEIILLYSYLYNKMIKTKTRQFNISSKGANNGSYKSDVTISLPDLHFNEKDITNVLFSVDHCEVCNSYYIVNTDMKTNKMLSASRDYWNKKYSNEDNNLQDIFNNCVDNHFDLKNPSLGFTLDKSDLLFESLSSSQELIKNNSQTLFNKIYSQKKRVPPYYFRTLDEEFR